MKKEIVITSSGNVFEDLGLDAAEVSVLKIRSMLMNDLRAYIKKNALTQMDAAERLGISQSRASDLVRGKWQKFNLEMLITLETRLGKKISLELVV